MAGRKAVRRPPAVPRSVRVGGLLGRSKEIYLDGVGREAVKRAGAGLQTKGTVHEILFRDRRNRSLGALLRGERTALTRSSRARVVDVVTSRNGKVVRRIQLKDAVSRTGIGDVQRRVENGQYRSAGLVGTDETVKRWGLTGSRKRMESSGVSSTTTTRVADNAGAQVPNKNLFRNNAKDIGKSAAAASVTSAALGATLEVAASYSELRANNITKREFMTRVGVSGAKSGLAAGATTGSALFVKEGAKLAAKRVGRASARKFAGSNAVTVVAFAAVEQGAQTVQLARGTIDGSEYAVRSARNAGSTGGAVAGAWLGGIAGSFAPGPGTALGVAVGSAVGAVAGGWISEKVGRSVIARTADVVAAEQVPASMADAVLPAIHSIVESVNVAEVVEDEQTTAVAKQPETSSVDSARQRWALPTISSRRPRVLITPYAIAVPSGL